MYSDRNLINRRNVKGDVTSAVNACRRFFELEVQSRIIAAALKILGMNNIDDLKPTENVFADGPRVTIQAKKKYLHNISTLVIDSYVIDKDRNKNMEKTVQSIQQEEAVNPDGRYPCRFPGCTKSFAQNKKLRKDHESSHNPPLVVDESPAHILKSKGSSEEGDDMYAYQIALLDYGLLILNFFDGITMGDGERVIRCWKFFLMYLKHQGKSSTKYSLEALYLMFQLHALLSPQSAHSLIWNRFVKNKPGMGGNIPLDLQLEFYNKSVKEAIKKLGPNASRKSLDRI